MGVKFLGIEERGMGPVALFDKGFVEYYFSNRGMVSPSSEFCLSRESVLIRIKNRKKDGYGITEEERALQALDKYQEVSK